MDTITRTFAGTRRSFPVYTQAEADQQRLSYKPWKEALPGEYGLSDDGYVAVCLCIREYTSRHGGSRKLYTYPYGRIWASDSAKLQYEQRQLSGFWSATSATTWQQAEAKRGRTKRMVQTYVQMTIQGQIDYDLLGRIYRSDQQIPAATVRRLLKEGRIKQMVDEELGSVLSRNGLTVERVLAEYEDAMRRAKVEENLPVLRDLVFKLSEMLGMMPR